MANGFQTQLMPGEVGGMPTDALLGGGAGLTAIAQLARELGVPADILLKQRPEVLIELIRKRQLAQQPTVPTEQVVPQETDSMTDLLKEVVSQTAKPADLSAARQAATMMAPIGRGAEPAPMISAIPTITGTAGQGMLQDLAMAVAARPVGVPGEAQGPSPAAIAQAQQGRGAQVLEAIGQQNRLMAEEATRQQRALEAQQAARGAMGQQMAGIEQEQARQEQARQQLRANIAAGEANRAIQALQLKKDQQSQIWGLLDKVTSDIGQKDPAMKGRIWQRFSEELQQTPITRAEQALPIIEKVLKEDREKYGGIGTPSSLGDQPIGAAVPAVSPATVTTTPQEVVTAPIPPVVSQVGLRATESEFNRVMLRPAPNPTDYYGRPDEYNKDLRTWSEERLKAAENLSQAQGRQATMEEQARKADMAARGVTEGSLSEANKGNAAIAGAREINEQYRRLVQQYENRVREVIGNEYDKIPASDRGGLTREQFIQEAIQPTGLLARIKGGVARIKGELSNDPVILGIESLKTKMAAQFTRTTDANPGVIQIKMNREAIPGFAQGIARMKEFADGIDGELDVGARHNLQILNRSENDPRFSYLFRKQITSSPSPTTGRPTAGAPKRMKDPKTGKRYYLHDDGRLEEIR